jgi:hypothetical protein
MFTLFLQGGMSEFARFGLLRFIVIGNLGVILGAIKNGMPYP